MLIGAATAIGLAALPQRRARADDFPTHPIRIEVPTEPGGTVDFVARLLAQKLSETWTHGVVIENRAGAGGVVGALYVARAAPDGYTLGLFTTSFTTNAATNAHLPYDALSDFTPVSLVSYSTYMLVCNPALPVHTMAELVAYARQHPGELNYGSAGVGGSLHLATEMLDRMAGIKMNHVPYKGTAPAATATIANQVQLTISSLVAGEELVKAGKLRALAVTGAQRSQILPDLPTIGETVRGYEFNNWFGLLAPKGTPQPIVNVIHAQVAKVLALPDVKKALLAQSVEPAPLDAARFESMMRKEIANYSKLAQELSIQLN
jgi:tripartite-type tricarboxylate transporter receptor subunit TctC